MKHNKEYKTTLKIKNYLFSKLKKKKHIYCKRIRTYAFVFLIKPVQEIIVICDLMSKFLY